MKSYITLLLLAVGYSADSDDWNGEASSAATEDAWSTTTTADDAWGTKAVVDDAWGTTEAWAEDTWDKEDEDAMWSPVTY